MRSYMCGLGNGDAMGGHGLFAHTSHSTSQRLLETAAGQPQPQPQPQTHLKQRKRGADGVMVDGEGQGLAQLLGEHLDVGACSGRRLRQE